MTGITVGRVIPILRIFDLAKADEFRQTTCSLDEDTALVRL